MELALCAMSPWKCMPFHLSKPLKDTNIVNTVELSDAYGLIDMLTKLYFQLLFQHNLHETYVKSIIRR
jgi:hypothetical protein